MEEPVVIIGGGITGLGIARDLAMRNIEVVLLEKGKIGEETSTDFHGMLHSGARYAVKDPYAAKKCMQENKILKEIAPDYIEDTGGLFLKLEADSEDYFQKKLESCKDCEILVKQLNGEQALEKYPKISEDTDKALEVPDGVIKPVQFLNATLKSAENNGAKINTHTEVRDIEISNRRVQSLETQSDGKNRKIEPGIVVNATGPWAEKIGELAGIDISMMPTKGVLTVAENPGTETILNRCRPTGNGDIVLPSSGKIIIGTTSEEVEDPDNYSKNQSEEDLMIEQADQMLKEVSEEDLIKSYWGLRPLYDPDSEKDERDVTREFHLIDHEKRDDIENMLTVIGGKWTTHRFMAEKTSDLVCEKLKVDRKCQTQTTKLPEKSEIDASREWPTI